MKLSGCNRRNRMNMKRISRISIFIYIALLALSCQEKKPSMVEQRKAEIRRNDSLELAQAQQDLQVADSMAAVKVYELDNLKKQFVFEKQEKYQTMGYWVLPAYKGSKERFSFFPEVEEGGKLLLVSIDKRRQYAFAEVDLESDDYTSQLPKALSDAQKRDVARCYELAKTMKDLDEARHQQEKMQMKVRFYEEKKTRTNL